MDMMLEALFLMDHFNTCHGTQWKGSLGHQTTDRFGEGIGPSPQLSIYPCIFLVLFTVKTLEVEFIDPRLPIYGKNEAKDKQLQDGREKNVFSIRFRKI